MKLGQIYSHRTHSFRWVVNLLNWPWKTYLSFHFLPYVVIQPASKLPNRSKKRAQGSFAYAVCFTLGVAARSQRMRSPFPRCREKKSDQFGGSSSCVWANTHTWCAVSEPRVFGLEVWKTFFFFYSCCSNCQLDSRCVERPGTSLWNCQKEEKEKKRGKKSNMTNWYIYIYMYSHSWTAKPL